MLKLIFMKIINTNQAPLAVGPYSQAIVVNGMVFCAGQVGLNPENGELVNGIEAQTHQVLKNLQAVLKKAGSSLERIVKTTIFLQNMDDFAKVNEIYGSYFKNHKPARSTVEVSKLPKDALIEIEAIALTK